MKHELLIDGRWCPAGDGSTLDVLDPATATVLGQVASATADDVDRALAVTGRSGWDETDPWARSAVLRRAAALLGERAGEIAAILSAEQGKPVAEARAEITGAVEIIDWCADEARRIYGRVVPARASDVRLLVTRRAVGPVAAFTASNFPALLPARKLGAALAAGCPVLLKPAEDTPFTALEIGQAFIDAGLPDGVLNIVTGEPASIARHVISSPVIRKVSLTGSVPVGRELLRQAAERVIPSSMELGGHAAAIVFPDADLGAVADAIVAGKWRNCGQVCIAVSRLLVHRAAYEELVGLLVQRIRSLRLGAGSDPGTQVGPLISERSRDRVEGLLSDAVARGAVIRVGGRRPSGPGFFFEPTLITDVPDSARILIEEPFGPVLPVHAFDDTDEAIARANGTGFGLSGFVFTRDLRTAMEVSDRLDAGMVGVNSLVIATAEAPAGGVKESGFGREGGSESLADYTVTKYVHLRLA